MSSAPPAPRVNLPPPPPPPRWGKHGWKAITVAVAVGLVAAGIGFAVYRYYYADASNGKVDATVVLINPQYRSIACTLSANPIYFEISFEIKSISAPVTTAQFGVEVVSPFSTVIPANSTAPEEQANLPCAAGTPNGWYVEYTDGANGPWATFPWGPNDWSTGKSGPLALHTSGWFALVSSSDMTGTEDNITAYGIGGSHVTFTGETQFPPWQGP